MRHSLCFSIFALECLVLLLTFQWFDHFERATATALRSKTYQALGFAEGSDSETQHEEAASGDTPLVGGHDHGREVRFLALALSFADAEADEEMWKETLKAPVKKENSC